MSTPQQEALTIIDKLGADFQETGNGRTDLKGDAWSPTGRVWAATGCHTLAINFHTNRPAAWKALLDDLKLGTEPCTTEDCEGCEP